MNPFPTLSVPKRREASTWTCAQRREEIVYHKSNYWTIVTGETELLFMKNTAFSNY